MSKKQKLPKNTYTFTEEQFKSLKDIASSIITVRHTIDDLFDKDLKTLKEIGFLAGKAFVKINDAEDDLLEIINFFEDDRIFLY